MSVNASTEIQIRDVYRMLTYALRTYDLVEFDDVALDRYSGLEQVLAELLIHGVNIQRKRGLEHGYISRRDDLAYVRGRLHPVETVLNQSRGRFLADCTFDEYTIDTFLNRILKLAMIHTLTIKDVTVEQKVKVRGLLPYFDAVSNMSNHRIPWGRARFDRNNGSYRLLLHVAYLLLNDLGLTSEMDSVSSYGIQVRDMHLLFQYFVLNYFKRHFPDIHVRSERILKGGVKKKTRQLPVLKPDITLESEDQAVVIDTKFYEKILVVNRFGSEKLRSSHRNQILAYALHIKAMTEKNVSGVLLYAQTKSETPEDVNFDWEELGIPFQTRTVDLGCPFVQVSQTLDELVRDYFPKAVRHT